MSELFLQSSNESWQALCLNLIAKNFDVANKITPAADISSLAISNSFKLTKLSSILSNLKFKSNNNLLLSNNDPINKHEIFHWINLIEKNLYNVDRQSWLLNLIEEELELRSFIVGQELSFADVAVFSGLKCLKGFTAANNTKRYLNLVESKLKMPEAGAGSFAASKVTAPKAAKPAKTGVKTEGNAEQGKFGELKNAKMGQVVTRFPPEASGFLHIGHAKAALLNYHYRNEFQGKLQMRFDDTNPDKENEHFEKIILEDMKLLKIEYDNFSCTSDHFPKMLDMCVDLIKKGHAYVDDTPIEQMRYEKENKIAGKCRDNPVDKNMKMWDEMVRGTDYGKTCCVRAKMHIESANGALRDPVMYRCKDTPHPKTGNKYKVYPTYDFACPIVDSIEGITHALRTSEYLDRDDQYYWFIEKLGIRKPDIKSYSRLNLMNTVLSKRKLAWFVEQGITDGWDDPRMPTVRGILRQGLTVEGLQDFIKAQGDSTRIVQCSWDKIWAFNKKIIDPITKRYSAVDQVANVLVNVSSTDAQAFEPREENAHPKNEDLGKKFVYPSKQVYVEYDDAADFVEGENVTFVNWGNLKVDKIVKNSQGKIENINMSTNLQDTNFKKTLKVTWVPKRAENIPVKAVHFDNIISKEVLEKEDDFKDFVNRDSRHEYDLIGDEDIKNLKQDDMIQLQRRGYYRVDVPYKAFNPITSREEPAVLYYIPDGKVGSSEPKFGKAKPVDKNAKKSEPVKKSAKSAAKPSKSSGVDAMALFNATKAAGDKVAALKKAKASKDEITAAVKILLDNKAKYKEALGHDYDAKKPPQAAASAAAAPAAGNDAMALFNATKAAGDKVAALKKAKASKDEVTAAVKVLLDNKAKYKAALGHDYDANKPPQPAASAPAAPASAASNDAMALFNATKASGDKVAALKKAKAPKDEITAAVKILLDNKANYIAAVGSDYDANKPPQSAAAAAPVATKSSGSSNAMALFNETKAAGDKVAALKKAKAPKDEITAAVQVLLANKAKYKEALGHDYDAKKPPQQEKAAANTSSSADDQAMALFNETKAAGDKVAALKKAKAPKDEITAAVQVLLANKAKYKAALGHDYDAKKPPVSTTNLTNSVDSNNNPITLSETKKPSGDQNPSNPNPNMEAMNFYNACKTAGDQVRKLKAEKADISEALAKLKDSKAAYKNALGHDYNEKKPPTGVASPEAKGDTARAATPKQTKKDKKEKKEKVKKVDENIKGKTKLGVSAKKELATLSDWYTQTITKAEMIEYYTVSGCYILRPWSFSIWEGIQSFFDAKIKKLGVKNSYFPMFVSKSALEKEQDHIDDFAPEVAWVTKSGQSELEEPIAIRPTSETVMYPAYAKWVQSHRDLPIKLNQWCNVVRWEFKHPTPFLRTREFLWQEGHCAFATKEECEEHTHVIGDLYREVYEDLLAIPVVPGKKTEKEKFAGGDWTITVEAFCRVAGRSVQGGTSHFLGQNFSKMFDISFENPDKGSDPNAPKKLFAYQNSWGISTRMIGCLIMVHGDDKGLVLPPRLACTQTILVPCGFKTEEDRSKIEAKLQEINDRLVNNNTRSETDFRTHITPAWKFNHWEQKGVPIRIEIGPRDLQNNSCVLVRRDTGEKVILKGENDMANIEKTVADLLETIQADMLQGARDDLTKHMRFADKWEDFIQGVKDGCLVQIPFCGEPKWEDEIKRKSAEDTGGEGDDKGPSMGAKSLCIPFKPLRPLTSDMKCIISGKPATQVTMFGRSY